MSTLKLKPRDWTLASHLVMSGQGGSGGQTIPEFYAKVAPEELRRQNAENADEVNRLKVAVNRAVKYLVRIGLATKSDQKRSKLGGHNRPANIFFPTDKALGLTFPDEVADSWDTRVVPPRRDTVKAGKTPVVEPKPTLVEDEVDLSDAIDDDDYDWTPGGDDFSESTDETFGEDEQEIEVAQPALVVHESVDISRTELALGNIELRAQAAISSLKKQDSSAALKHLTAILAEAQG